MSNWIELTNELASCDNISDTLRRIADDLDLNDYGVITTAVLCLGHTGPRIIEDGEIKHEEVIHTFGLGPRADAFTVRGLLAACLGDI